MSFQRFLVGKAKHLGSNGIYWAFPLTVGLTWLIWDALDEEWLVSLKLATDPEALNKRIETERLARLEALKKPKPTILKSPVAKETPVEIEDDEPEEDEVPEEEKEDSPSEEVEEEAPADEDSEDVPAGEDGDDAAEEGEEEEEEEEEESEVVIKPLYDPIKGKKLGKKDIWDNFTIKALNMGEDDDDDDEEEEEEEGTYIKRFFLAFSLLYTILI